MAVTSAPVTLGDVTSRVSLPGVLGFDGDRSVVSGLPPGVVTAAPRPGAVLRRGARLFAVAGVRATLLYGTVPAYRRFAPGMGDGRDVEQLERNLSALGMDPGRVMTVDRHFSTATAAAVRRWQAARGLSAARRTGTLDLGEVVFLPGPARVARVVAAPGTLAGPGARMLTATSTTRVVRVALPTDRRHQVRAGDRVEVLPPGATRPVRGRVRAVGEVAAAAGQEGGTATVPVTITLIRPGAAFTGLDLAPVQVGIVGERRRGVLTVPVTALLARPGGGYQLAVLDGAARRLLPVEPGLYDEDAGTVEVTGGGLREGARVEVPLS
ncbi:peptidoglycan-binding protein [Sphaerisporangium aureirubrum]|uniref:peptidoglycan-binding protein n=1 Tax=Sphaerisporangium aureirubrum TaxID=1544736 RepID=UPI00362AD42E